MTINFESAFSESPIEFRHDISPSEQIGCNFHEFRKGTISDELALTHLRLNPYHKIAVNTLDASRMPGIEHYQEFCRSARESKFIGRTGRENFDQKLDPEVAKSLANILVNCVNNDQSYPDFLRVHIRLLLCWFCNSYEDQIGYNRSFQYDLLRQTKQFGSDYKVSPHLVYNFAERDLPLPANRYSYTKTDFWQFTPLMKQVNPQIVIFGPGDLFLRQVLPQLFALTQFTNIHKQSYLGDKTKIIVVGEGPESDLVPFGQSRKATGLDDSKSSEDCMTFKRYVIESCKNKKIKLPPNFEKIFDQLEYLPFSADESYQLKDQIAARRDGDQSSLFFLSVPPQAYRKIWGEISGIVRSDDLVFFEKPFGVSSEDSRDLHTMVNGSISRKQVHTIDHYFGKEAYAIMPLARRQFLDPFLNNGYVDSIEIVCSENLNVEGRGFYDSIGALKDMLQSHMLGLLSLVAADLPAIDDSSASSYARENLKFLRTLPAIKQDDVFLGQYSRYKNDLGLEHSNTPTFFTASMKAQSERWQGVKFQFMHGKELDKKFGQIVINFRVDNQDPDCPKKVVLAIQPNPRLLVWFHDSKEPEVIKLEEPGVFSSHAEAYSRLFLHALHGNPIANRTEAVLQQWRIVSKISNSDIQPVLYREGSHGPEEAPRFEEMESSDPTKHFYFGH